MVRRAVLTGATSTHRLPVSYSVALCLPSDSSRPCAATGVDPSPGTGPGGRPRRGAGRPPPTTAAPVLSEWRCRAVRAALARPSPARYRAAMPARRATAVQRPTSARTFAAKSAGTIGAGSAPAEASTWR
jgi:hypothetical protein